MIKYIKQQILLSAKGENMLIRFFLFYIKIDY